jgi:hypothetical protein
MSAGDAKLGSGASHEERTEQLGRSLTDCAMLSVAVATVQYSVNVFMLIRTHDLPPMVHSDPFEGLKAIITSAVY